MWQLVENRASFSLGLLRGQLDAAQPEKGLTIHLGGGEWSGTTLFHVQLPSGDSLPDLQPAEVYVRGRDLVATYAPLPPYTIQPQIYWRLRDEPALGACGVELMLSVQTSLLYSEPQTPVFSEVAGIQSITAWSRGGPTQSLRLPDLPRTLLASDGMEGLLAFEPAVGGFVYLEMIHPSDFHAVTVESTAAGKVKVVAQIFQEHLEKGVIRRARACGWFLPQADWRRYAGRLFKAYRNESPPLTA